MTTIKTRRAHEWVTWLRLLRYVKPYRWRLVAGFLAGLFYAGANGAMVWGIKGGIGELVNPETVGMGGLVFIALVCFPIIALIRGLADFLSVYYIRWVGNRVVMDLRNEMFTHLHALSVAYFSRSRTGELISRTTNDTTLIERAVSSVLTDLAKEPFTLFAMVGAVFWLDARLAAISLAVFPFFILPVATFGRRVRTHARQAQEQVADFVSILQETVSGTRIVKAFGMEEYEGRRFREKTGGFFRRTMSAAKASAIVEPIIVLVSTVGIGLVLVYVGYSGMGVDDFFAFAAALMLMYEPVKKLSRLHVQIQHSSASADRVFETLDTEISVREAPDAVKFEDELRDIEFEDVSFAYDKEAILSHITFNVRAGQRIALVGSSGSGKTTLVNLLPRFFDVTGGRVLLNGYDVRDLTLRSLRGRIGLVTQETFLFNDTVANNIGYGCFGASRAAIEDAARRAHAHDFIAAMPEGYDTLVGERGICLSGGQRQRLAIARAILRNPPILILDEATSALDTESERLVQAAIDELMAGRTVFAIAHRLSTIRHCDSILVLHQGRIIEQGRHEDLLALSGAYKRLYDMQFGLDREV